ncbi:MAG TPA: MarP family serine protease [Kineosporiaceae bacterium]|nr:MarP family serine protease [Kineosporiaceae bacterium]
MIDVILLVIVASYAVSGYRQGLAVGALSLGGFLVGALVAMTIVPPMAEGLEKGVQRSFIVLLCVLLFAWLGQLGGALVGARLRQNLTVRSAQVADQVLGMLAGVVAVVLVLWFVGGALRASPAPDVNRAVASSRLLTVVGRYMPSDIDALAENFRRTVATGDFPRVFEGVAPEDIVPVGKPDAGAVQRSTITTAQRSIVKILGEAPACRQGQEGSGAVVAPQRVVTNAHVVAGVQNPTVQVGGVGPRLPAQVVLFDPRRDVAVLAVPGLSAPPLPFVQENLTRGADAVVAGFPRNLAFAAGAARVRNVLTAVGEDIYGKPGATRQVYALYADVQPGNSGGPLLDARGRFAGVVFARSLDDPNTGYALTLDEVRADVTAGIRADEKVSTGGCASG